MNENQDFTKSSNCHLFVYIHPDVSKKKDILLYLARRLYEEGCVKSSYGRAVLKREKEFPTGLKLEGLYNIALAHAGPEYVYQNAIVVGVLDQPVEFQLMEDSDRTIPVRVVFMFAAISYDSINHYIDNLVREVLLKPEVVSWIIGIDNEEQVYSSLKQLVFGRGIN